MKKLLITLLAVLVAFGAYATHKHKKKKKTANGIVSVQMHRTPCFGKCPEYTIDIDNGGVATYTGIRFTTDSGVYKKNIGTIKARDIIAKFMSYRVDTCNNRYPNRIPDVPGINFTITYRDSTKKIQNANFGPGFLRELATDMDDAAKKTDDSWNKVK